MKYPVIEKGAKVGIHALQASSFKWVEEAVKRGITWPVVKSVGDVAWLSNVKKISPDTITVARVAHNDAGLGEGVTGIEFIQNGDYSNYVRMLFSPLLKTLLLNPKLRQDVDYWEVVNEPDPPDIADSLNSPNDLDGYRKLAECMIACMAEAEKHGIKLALFALNAGTPEWYEIDAMIQTGVFKRAKAGGHIISVHEGVFKDVINRRWGEVDQWYGGAIPTIDQHDPNTEWVQLQGNKFIVSKNPTELPKNQYTAGPLNFRYRYWLQRLRDLDQVVPFLVSEIRLGPTETYDKTLPWYDKHAADDPELIAYLPFTWSPFNKNEWGDADMEAASEVVLSYMQQVKNRPNALPKATTPPPHPPVEPPPPPPVEPPPPPVEPPPPPPPPSPPPPAPVVVKPPVVAFADLLAHPSRLDISAESALHQRILQDGKRIASNEVQLTINGIECIALLVSDESYQDLMMYYVPLGNNRADAVQVYEPSAEPVTNTLEAWPTDHKLITQEFGARPGYYSQFGLRAHEGVDIRAPIGSPIRSVYSGKVIHTGRKRLSDPTKNSNYRWHVWVERTNGERWAYAYLDKNIPVSVGQEILAGEVVGFCSSTGQAGGPHVHISLQIPGATEAGDTDYQFDYVDPTPRFLTFAPERPYQGGYLEYQRAETIYPAAIDTSKFRADIAWDTTVKLNAQGIYCVMPRASSGITPDPEFVPSMIRLMAARQRGEQIVIIPFHDVHPHHNADQQAKTFQDQVSKFGGWRAWMFDVESIEGVRPLPKEWQVKAFVDAVNKRIGNRPKLYYSRTSLINEVSKTNTFGADLMLAAYGARDPILPEAFKAKGQMWTFHQFTDRYTLEGYTDVEGQEDLGVDKSYFNGTVEDLIAWQWKKAEQIVVTPPPPKPPVIIKPAQRINLLPYWRGRPGLAHNLRSFVGTHENNETVQTIMLPDGGWAIVKNQAMQRYFLREHEGRMFIWQGPDTSPGNGRFYATFFNLALGAPVCPVEMAVGEEWRNSRPHYVQFYNMGDGQPSQANSGVATNWIKLHAHHPSRTFNGIVVNDVIEIGNNEVHLLARDRTLVGWKRLHDDPHTPQSAGLSEIHIPGSRIANPQPLPHFEMPQAARPF